MVVELAVELSVRTRDLIIGCGENGRQRIVQRLKCQGGGNFFMKTILTGILSLGVMLTSAGYSVAQTATPGRTAGSVQAASVGGRARGDYDSRGIRAGSFFLYPSVVETFSYDDNVFATKVSKKDDFIVTSAPTLQILSNWGRHRLDLLLGAVDVRHANFSSEDHTDFNGLADWQLDVTRSFNIAGKLGASFLTESRGQADAPTAAAEPTDYRKYDASVSLNKQFNRFTFQLGGAVQALDYDDVRALDGTTIDQDIRDGRVYTEIGKVAYEFSPGYRVFGLVEANQRNFGNAADDRNSKGIETRAGLEFEVTHLVKGEISAGYFEQNYDQVGFSNTSGMAFKGGLLWNPTQLMTVNLSGERRVSETSVAGSSGHVDTLLTSKIDYEIMRNLIGSPFVNYTIEDYKGVNREDKTLQAGINMQLLINRHLSAGAFYTFTTKNSNLDTFDYDKNVVGGTLKLQF